MAEASSQILAHGKASDTARPP